MQRVKRIRLHVMRSLAGATDSADYRSPMRRHLQLRQRHLHGRDHSEISAARTPIIMNVRFKILRLQRLQIRCRCAHSPKLPVTGCTPAAAAPLVPTSSDAFLAAQASRRIPDCRRPAQPPSLAKLPVVPLLPLSRPPEPRGSLPPKTAGHRISPLDAARKFPSPRESLAPIVPNNFRQDKPRAPLAPESP